MLLVFLFQLRVGEEAEGVDPIVDGDKDNSPPGHVLAVELLLAAGAVHEGPAVNPEHHRQLIAGSGALRGPDIQVQAVLAVGGHWHIVELLAVEVQAAQVRLGAGAAELLTAQHTIPGLVLLRAAKAQLTHRRRGVGYAPEHHGPAGQKALYLALFCGDCRLHFESLLCVFYYIQFLIYSATTVR